jgi:hypothetical protein
VQPPLLPRVSACLEKINIKTPKPKKFGNRKPCKKGEGRRRKVENEGEEREKGKEAYPRATKKKHTKIDQGGENGQDFIFESQGG